MRDLAGQRFGRLEVVSFAGIERGVTKWLCRCDCGLEKSVGGWNLINGNSTSCGCWNVKPIIDLTGQRFGRWEVLGFGGHSEKKKPIWICICDCGQAKEVDGSSLRSRGTTSCGCTSWKHGGSYTPEYRVRYGMISRCENSKDKKKWRLYGGRGIKVCRRWRESFAAFFSDVGPRPSPKHSIDRIDPDGDYEPGNVRWATVEEQRHNQRRCRPTEGDLTQR
jgi:hypothetical protein